MYLGNDSGDPHLYALGGRYGLGGADVGRWVGADFGLAGDDIEGWAGCS